MLGGKPTRSAAQRDRKRGGRDYTVAARTLSLLRCSMDHGGPAPLCGPAAATGTAPGSHARRVQAGPLAAKRSGAALELGWANGRRQRKTVSAKTEREAWDKLDKLKKDHERGLNLMEPSRTVAEWLDMWLSEVKAHDGTRPATLTLYRGLADRYVKPVIGTVRLDRLKPTRIQRLISATRKSETSRGRPPSASTLRHVHTLIRNALNDAYLMELVTRNVAAQVKAPPIPRKRRQDLTIEGAKRLLTVLEGERLEALFVLALATGLRRGELLGLH